MVYTSCTLISILLIFALIMYLYVPVSSPAMVQSGGVSDLTTYNLISETSPLTASRRHRRRYENHLVNNYRDREYSWWNPVRYYPVFFPSYYQQPYYSLSPDSCQQYAVSKCHDAIFPERCYTNYYERCRLGL